MAETNADQRVYWNETTGPTWVERQEQLDAVIAPAGALALERAAPKPGERVLDIGCGCGQTSLELARRVAPGGEVLGLDISRPMLDRARERRSQAGLANLAFLEADAQSHGLETDFDLLYSRFGVMFFADPVAAFTNLRSALVPGGRLAFVCWRALAENPWVWVPLQAAAAHVQLPPPLAPGEPGPFSLANEIHVRRVLEASGWLDIHVEPRELELTLDAGAGIPGAVEFLLEMGPTARVLRDTSAELRERVAEAIADAVRPFATPGGVTLEGAVWIVSARAA